jgi:hypothetical protein
MCWTQFTVRVL